MDWTISRLIQWTTHYFQEKGIATARLDAEVLLADVLKTDRLHLYLDFDKPIDQTERLYFKELVRRRADREPIAYITGRKEFFSLDLRVDRSVLVPRPETEKLVEVCLESARPMLESGITPRILDIGTGSGAIICAIAANLDQGEFYATDCDQAALQIARHNASELGLSDRLNVVQADLFPSDESLPPTFDIIVSNPPYISSAAIEGLEPEIKLFEPRSALDGGPDGLTYYRRIVASSFKKLSKIGIIVLEVDDLVCQRVMTLIEHTDHFGYITCLKDLAGHQRVVRASRLDS
ncbi:peptide chain release factor N(5)-glutamine methyltransferase [bacterium]|nr:peptide chain release factor N(5)-glutamine methyltransferase [bacterium]